MKIRDAEQYKRTKEINKSEGFGWIIDIADRWMELMEQEVAKGKI